MSAPGISGSDILGAGEAISGIAKGVGEAVSGFFRGVGEGAKAPDGAIRVRRKDGSTFEFNPANIAVGGMGLVGAYAMFRLLRDGPGILLHGTGPFFPPVSGPPVEPGGGPVDNPTPAPPPPPDPTTPPPATAPPQIPPTVIPPGLGPQEPNVYLPPPEPVPFRLPPGPRPPPLPPGGDHPFTLPPSSPPPTPPGLPPYFPPVALPPKDDPRNPPPELPPSSIDTNVIEVRAAKREQRSLPPPSSAPTITRAQQPTVQTYRPHTTGGGFDAAGAISSLAAPVLAPLFGSIASGAGAVIAAGASALSGTPTATASSGGSGSTPPTPGPAPLPDSVQQTIADRQDRLASERQV